MSNYRAMSGDQITFVTAAFLIIAVITVFAQFRWMRPGRVQTVCVFLAGVLTIASLWAAGLPPQWFAGTKAGFSLAGSMGVGAWLARAGGGDRRAFGFPLFLGLSLALLVANVLAYAKGHL